MAPFIASSGLSVGKTTIPASIRPPAKSLSSPAINLAHQPFEQRGAISVMGCRAIHGSLLKGMPLAAS